MNLLQFLLSLDAILLKLSDNFFNGIILIYFFNWVFFSWDLHLMNGGEIWHFLLHDFSWQFGWVFELLNNTFLKSFIENIWGDILNEVWKRRRILYEEFGGLESHIRILRVETLFKEIQDIFFEIILLGVSKSLSKDLNKILVDSYGFILTF